jgi:hypothetical protein
VRRRAAFLTPLQRAAASARGSVLRTGWRAKRVSRVPLQAAQSPNLTLTGAFWRALPFPCAAPALAPTPRRCTPRLRR